MPGVTEQEIAQAKQMNLYQYTDQQKDQLGEQHLPRGAVPAQHYLNGCGQYGLAVDLQPGYGFDQQLPDGNRTE